MSGGEKGKQSVVREERGVGEKGKLSSVQEHQGKAKMRRMPQEKIAYYKRLMATDLEATLLPEEYAPRFPGGLDAIRMINQNALELYNCTRRILELHEANGYMEYIPTAVLPHTSSSSSPKASKRNQARSKPDLITIAI